MISLDQRLALVFVKLGRAFDLWRNKRNKKKEGQNEPNALNL